MTCLFCFPLETKMPDQEVTNFINSTAGIVTTVVGTAVVMGAAALATRVRVCKPNQFLVKTGMGLNNMKVGKKGVLLPFQKGTVIDMNPSTYSFNLHNMSKGKVEFKLPVVFTIGPVDPSVDIEGFERFAQTMNEMSESTMHQTIQGIVEGETRGLTANLTVEEMFNAKDKFRQEVVEKIQFDLDKMGLNIYNANIKEMGDYDENNKYFEYRKQRAIQTANYEAQVEVAEAEKHGKIGMKERERDTRISVATMDTAATIEENQKREEIAKSCAALAKVEAESKLISDLADIEADNRAQERIEQMQKDVETEKFAKEMERLRAENLSKSKIEAESLIAKASGQAESIRLVAEAERYRDEQKAEGILAILNSQAEGLGRMSSTSELAQFYLALEKNLYQDLAQKQSEAFQGLQPNFQIWNTGSGEGTDPAASIIKTFQSVAPLLDGLKRQSGIGVLEKLSDK